MLCDLRAIPCLVVYGVFFFNFLFELYAQVMGLTVVNVGGLDIIDGNHKMTLAIMWQLMRRHTLNLLQVHVTAAPQVVECLPPRYKPPRVNMLLLLLLFCTIHTYTHT